MPGKPVRLTTGVAKRRSNVICSKRLGQWNDQSRNILNDLDFILALHFAVGPTERTILKKTSIRDCLFTVEEPPAGPGEKPVPLNQTIADVDLVLTFLSLDMPRPF